MQPVLSLPCCTKSPPLLVTHSPISSRAIKPGSLAAPARRSHPLVTDCCVFNELRKTRDAQAAGRCRFAAQAAKSTLLQTTHRCWAARSSKGFMGDAGLGNSRGHGGGSVGKSFLTQKAPSLPPLCLPLAGVGGNRGTNSREKCLLVARRINKGSRFVFQEPSSSLKAISQLRNEPPEPAQAPKCFGLMQTAGCAGDSRYVCHPVWAQTLSTDSI